MRLAPLFIIIGAPLSSAFISQPLLLLDGCADPLRSSLLMPSIRTKTFSFLFHIQHPPKAPWHNRDEKVTARLHFYLDAGNAESIHHHKIILDFRLRAGRSRLVYTPSSTAAQAYRSDGHQRKMGRSKPQGLRCCWPNIYSIR